MKLIASQLRQPQFTCQTESEYYFPREIKNQLLLTFCQKKYKSLKLCDKSIRL